MARLMVMIPDLLSVLVEKGEITARYYNPGNLFDEVHILMTNDDKVSADAVRKTVGDAKLFIHNLPAGRELFYRTLGYRPFLLKSWAAPALKLAREIRPSMIRCHGASVNTFAASLIKKQLGVPYVVSLHINPDEDVRGRTRNFKQKVFANAQQSVECAGLLNADMVLPVYEPIVPYLKRLGVTKYQVAYNSLNPDFLTKKNDYKLHDPVRIVSVGRQFKEKNPDNIIRAIVKLPGAKLTIIGDGDYHDYLEGVAKECGVGDRVEFFRALPNDELCARLPEFDIFAVHTEYWEISKSVLEPLLAGLPLVINRRMGQPVPELQGDFLIMVNNSVDEYYGALKMLIEDDRMREQLGRKAYAHAQERWSPRATEQKFVQIYKQVMEQAKT